MSTYRIEIRLGEIIGSYQDEEGCVEVDRAPETWVLCWGDQVVAEVYTDEGYNTPGGYFDLREDLGIEHNGPQGLLIDDMDWGKHLVRRVLDLAVHGEAEGVAAYFGLREAQMHFSQSAASGPPGRATNEALQHPAGCRLSLDANVPALDILIPQRDEPHMIYSLEGWKIDHRRLDAYEALLSHHGARLPWLLQEGRLEEMGFDAPWREEKSEAAA